MKARTFLYAVLALAGLAAAVAVPVAVHRSGSAALPLWTAAATPGPLSRTHEFIGTQCESCHVPTRGVEASTCLTCHATAAPELLTRPATAFHATISECASCHVEHLGPDRRPVDMDHAVLVAEGHETRAATSRGRGEGHPDGKAHDIARIRAFLSDSGAHLLGGPPGPRPLPAWDAATLDCAGCHANRDPHRSLFGRDCQGCHDTAAWTVRGWRHPSSSSRDCDQCHQAPPSHYMMHFMMLRMMTGREHAEVEQCYLCHRTDSWNNIRGLGWFEMH